MIYFDYSATTPVNKKVLDKFVNDSLNYVGNSNSPHKLGKINNDYVLDCSERINQLLNLNNEYDIIYTSGSSESNNLAIKGFLNKYPNAHIITTRFEHSSVIAPIASFQRKGYIASFVDINEYGLIDLKALESLISESLVDNRPTLISIASVNSELGIKEPIEDISKLVQKYDNVYFHCDATQSIGKVNINFESVDFISFSAHKFYGIKGIGVLLKKKSVKIDTLINGGKSTTKFRSGTPAHPLIGSITYALELALSNLDENYKKVKELNEYFISKTKDNIVLNSNEYSIPHILNISLLNKSSIDVVMKLSEKDIFISNTSACSSDKNLSTAVMALTNDEKRASSSIRISISHLNSKEEVDILIAEIKKIINEE